MGTFQKLVAGVKERKELAPAPGERGVGVGVEPSRTSWRGVSLPFGQRGRCVPLDKK